MTGGLDQRHHGVRPSRPSATAAGKRSSRRGPRDACCGRSGASRGAVRSRLLCRQSDSARCSSRVRASAWLGHYASAPHSPCRARSRFRVVGAVVLSRRRAATSCLEAVAGAKARSGAQKAPPPVGYRSVRRRRLDVLAVTTVTGTPSCFTRDGRSRRSQCDTRAGSVETITSSNPSRSSASRTATSGLGSPMKPSTRPPDASSKSGIASSRGERSLLRFGVPIGPRYQQREAAPFPGGAAAHLVQEPGGAGSAVRHNQNPSRGRGLHLELLARSECPTRVGLPGSDQRARSRRSMSRARRHSPAPSPAPAASARPECCLPCPRDGRGAWRPPRELPLAGQTGVAGARCARGALPCRLNGRLSRIRGFESPRR